VRLLHTADWHLGRIFYGTSLLEDQAYALDGFCALAADLEPDVIVIAGDVYDRSVPPPEAVALLDDTLTRLLVETAAQVVVPAGNHDNPARLAFGRRLFSERGLHIAGPVESPGVSVAVSTAAGPVRVWALPHADPPEVAGALGVDDVRGHEAAMAARLALVRAGAAPHERQVVVAHAFVQGGRESESERPLTVGGTGQVPAALFDGFDYVALGHLHRPQSVGAAHIRYAGSLLKYSFDEHDHRKSVTLVELGPRVTVTEYELPCRRDVRKVRGYLADLLRGGAPAAAGETAAGGRAGAAAVFSAPDTPPPAPGCEDYLWVDLLDELPVPSPLERLRAVYPNVMYAARERASAAPGGGTGPGGIDDVRRLGVAELFAHFFNDTCEAELTAEQRERLSGLVEEFEKRRRSA